MYDFKPFVSLRLSSDERRRECRLLLREEMGVVADRDPQFYLLYHSRRKFQHGVLIAVDPPTNVSWQEQRNALSRGLEDFVSGIDEALLANHLLHPERLAEGQSLVTPKASTLAKLLQEYEVSLITERSTIQFMSHVL